MPLPDASYSLHPLWYACQTVQLQMMTCRFVAKKCPEMTLKQVQTLNNYTFYGPNGLSKVGTVPD